jgi:hypothetical protein
VGALAEKLYLGMLVGGADGPHGGGAGTDFVALTVAHFAQRFVVELHEPVGQVAQAARVGHEDHNVLAPLAKEVVNQGGLSREVGLQRTPSLLVGLARPGQQAFQVYLGKSQR